MCCFDYILLQHYVCVCGCVCIFVCVEISTYHIHMYMCMCVCIHILYSSASYATWLLHTLRFPMLFPMPFPLPDGCQVSQSVCDRWSGMRSMLRGVRPPCYYTQWHKLAASISRTLKPHVSAPGWLRRGNEGGGGEGGKGGHRRSDYTKCGLGFLGFF